MEGSELTSKFEGRTPMANIEYFDNKMKTERVAVQVRAATGAEIQPSRFLVRDRLRRRRGSRKWPSAHQSTDISSWSEPFDRNLGVLRSLYRNRPAGGQN